MKRELGKFEIASAISGENAAWNIVIVIFLKEVPSQEILRRAFDILQVRHPFLNVHLIKERGTYFFESGELPVIPVQNILRENDIHWVSVVEESLNLSFDTLHEPLMKCTTLSTDSEDGELILTAHHAITDGTSIEMFALELMELCATIHAGKEPEGFLPLDPMPPVEAFFPDEFRGSSLTRKSAGYFIKQMGDEIRYQLAIRGKQKPPIHPIAQVKVIHFKTSEETTSQLTQRARKERVTLNSLVNAAVLLAVRKVIYHDTSMPYRYMSMADLRPYLEPTPPPNQLGSYISPMRYTMMIKDGDNLWSLAKRINDQIYQSMKKGERYLAAIMSAQFLKMIFALKKFRMCTTAISYTGTSLHPIQSYAPYEVKAVRGFVSNFGLGPEFSGLVGLYSGELIWDMLYLETDMDEEGAIKLARHVNSLLADSVED